MTIGDLILILTIAAFGSFVGIVFGVAALRGWRFLHAWMDHRAYMKDLSRRMPEVVKPYDYRGLP